MTITRRSRAVYTTFTRRLDQKPVEGADRLVPRASRTAAPSTFLCLSETDLEILLALAWCAPVTTQQVQRLVVPAVSIRQIQRHLEKLADHNFVNGSLYYRQVHGRKPVRLGQIWSIGRQGEIALLHNDRMPDQPARVRQALVRHDLLLSELLSYMLPLAHPKLSAVKIRREVRIDPTQPKPKCDAYLELRTDGNEALQSIPWCEAAATPDERRTAWAVEADCGTESRAIIRAKAEAYRRVYEDPNFYRDGRRMPVPLWIVPDDVRANAILKEWYEVWPDGQWYMITADRLADLTATVYRDGGQRMHSLLAGWGL